MKRLLQWFHLSRAMGLRYVSFRIGYEIRRKCGLLKHAFPTNLAFRTWVTLEDWRKTAPAFFFDSREALTIPGAASETLKKEADRIFGGEIQFFHGEWKKADQSEWLKNPATGYVYEASRHWTEIPDFHPAYGDIKYVWEKSRFSFLQTILRYDIDHAVGSSDWVFQQIESWIDHNPINQGPNYRCSQEISLRIFNWLFALYFYRNSPSLTADRFNKIIFAIYWQVRHVRANIHFSRIAVRNNHAITETLALYTCGLLFPFFKESSEWRASGKKWFEKEIAYQIYEDGTYLQFSSNYHRVVIQLLTWAISLADIHHDKFNQIIYRRAYASLNLLLHCQDKVSGMLPNYGANDGSLFFDWNETGYRDFRPSLDALHFLLTNANLYAGRYQDQYWFGIRKGVAETMPIQVKDGTYSFSRGGLYVYRREAILLVINCVRYKDRPQQADNLHLDLWHNGQNLLWDAGSYRYNATPEMVKYFFGTESHNTVMLDAYDQMLKGQRFVWLGWSQGIDAGWRHEDGNIVFSGSAKVFTYLGNIVHTRSVAIKDSRIEVTDTVTGAANRTLRQLWHLNPEAADVITILPKSKDPLIKATRSEKYHSPTYGVLEKSTQLEFNTTVNTITAELLLK